MVVVASPLALGACSITPEPLSDAHIHTRVVEDRAALAKMRTPVTTPMTLTDVITRALMLNLDLRVDELTRLMESDSQVLAQLGLLPDASGNNSYTERNRPYGSAGSSEEINQKRRVTTLQVQWSSLDFAVAYLAARQAGNETLAAEERRRRAAGMLINELSYHFYRTLRSQDRMGRLNALDTRLDELLDLSNRLRDSHLEDPLTILGMQAGLYQVKRRVSGLRRDLELSREKLSRILNLPPDTPLHLSGSVDDVPVKLALGMNLDAAVDHALHRRPELRDFDYQLRNAGLDVWRSYIDATPNITGSYGKTTDTYTSNAVRSWNELGIRSVYRLINLVTFPWKSDKADLNVETVRLRRLAMSLAVMEQVRTSRIILEQTSRDVDLSNRIVQANDGIVEVWNLRLPFNTTDELSHFRAEVDGLLTHIDHDDLLAEQQRSLGDLLLSLGLHLAPEQLDLKNAETVHRQVQEHLAGLTEKLRVMAAPPAAEILAPPAAAAAAGP